VGNNGLEIYDWGARCRLAGGRRRYNAERRARRELRRLEVASMLHKYGGARGAQARIARELEVSPSVISRDVRALLRAARPPV
jgi:hypothetical protein